MQEEQSYLNIPTPMQLCHFEEVTKFCYGQPQCFSKESMQETYKLLIDPTTTMQPHIEIIPTPM